MWKGFSMYCIIKRREPPSLLPLRATGCSSAVKRANWTRSTHLFSGLQWWTFDDVNAKSNYVKHWKWTERNKWEAKIQWSRMGTSWVTSFAVWCDVHPLPLDLFQFRETPTIPSHHTYDICRAVEGGTLAVKRFSRVLYLLPILTCSQINTSKWKQI